MVKLNDISLREWQEKDLEHLRYEYDLKRDDLVFDIGSYRGEFADEIKRLFGCRVECFEALDNRAAGIEDGTIKMGGAFYYTSTYSDTLHTYYSCVDIAKYLNEEVALVKMNIEGYEYTLLPYMIAQGLMKWVKNLQVQFHEVEGSEKTYEHIREELSKTHRLTWRYPFCWENLERI